MDNEAALKIERSKKKSSSLPSMSNQETTNVDPKKRKTLEGSFNMQAKETLKYEIDIMFYSTGLPFRWQVYQFVTSSKVKWKFECRVHKDFVCT